MKQRMIVAIPCHDAQGKLRVWEDVTKRPQIIPTLISHGRIPDDSVAIMATVNVRNEYLEISTFSVDFPIVSPGQEAQFMAIDDFWELQESELTDNRQMIVQSHT